MTNWREFAYAQARLQARYGRRPDELLWRQLEGTGDLTLFLQRARTTALRGWLLNFTEQTGVHAIELALRQQFRNHVAELGAWLPPPWQPALLWTQRLVDLPALQRLLLGEPALLWMLEDPYLKPFAGESPATRIEALQASDCAPLLAAWQAGLPLRRAWLDHWRSLQPSGNHGWGARLEGLARLIETHLQVFTAAGADPWAARAALAAQLSRWFRRYPLQPATAFIYLALVALDLERLRAALVRRALFPRRVEAAA